MPLKIKKIESAEDVYDITVKDNHNFYANGILVHNCTEINLPTKPIKHIDDGKTVKRRIKVKKEDLEKFRKYENENTLFIKPEDL
jgi:hypothetical protein